MASIEEMKKEVDDFKKQILETIYVHEHSCTVGIPKPPPPMVQCTTLLRSFDIITTLFDLLKDKDTKVDDETTLTVPEKYLSMTGGEINENSSG